jgi:uncharacterized membrane protein YbaN (DUF454 family)
MDTSARETMKRRLFVTAGTITLTLGVIGIIVPVLPTTPFLILTAIYYTRGSERLYNALLTNRLCGSYIKNYLEGRGMSAGAKIRTLALLWVSIICTEVFLAETLFVRILLGVVLAGVTIHILSIKTLTKAESDRKG